VPTGPAAAPSANADGSPSGGTDGARALKDAVARLETELYEAHETMRRMHHELQDAQADLARDEVIFAEKNNELKRAQKEANAAAARVAELEEIMGSAAHAVQPLSASRTLGMGGSALGEVLRPHFVACPQPEDDDTVRYEDMSLTATAGATAAAAAAAAKAAAKAAPTEADQRMQAEMQLVAAERAAVVAERTELEALRRDLDGQAAKLASEQRRSEAVGTRKLAELEHDIGLKTELISELKRSEEELMQVRRVYEQRLHEMEQRVQSSAQMVDRIRQESADALEAVLDRNPIASPAQLSKNAQASEERRKLKESYEAKLRAALDELELRKQQQRELLRSLKGKEATEQRVEVLGAEIRRLHEECDAVRKKQRDERRRFDEERAQHAKEAQAKIAEAEKRMRELESDNRRQRVDLAKKADQLAAAQRKLSTIERPASAAGLEAKLLALEREVEEHVSRKEATETLERELAERERIVLEKERHLAAISQLEIKKLRASAELTQGLFKSARTPAAAGGLRAIGWTPSEEADLNEKRERLEALDCEVGSPPGHICTDIGGHICTGTGGPPPPLSRRLLGSPLLPTSAPGRGAPLAARLQGHGDRRPPGVGFAREHAARRAPRAGRDERRAAAHRRGAVLGARAAREEGRAREGGGALAGRGQVRRSAGAGALRSRVCNACAGTCARECVLRVLACVCTRACARVRARACVRV
jgi:hypothetical protein